MPTPPGTILHDGQLMLGDITLGVTDDWGVEWVLENLTGWSDAVGSTGTASQRASAHGAWLSTAYYAARVVGVEGSLLADTWDAAEAAVDRLMAAIPLDLPDTMLVETNSRVLQSDVRQDGDPLVEILGGWARFSLSLVAADPRRYDATSRSASLVLPLTTGGIAPPLTPPLTITGSSSLSQVTLVNDGTITTYPTLVITGPCPPATIINLTTGEAMRVVDSVLAGQTLIIDVLNGVATTGGQSRRVLGSWWGLVPGANEVAFTAAGYDAAAGLSISFRSAWK